MTLIDTHYLRDLGSIQQARSYGAQALAGIMPHGLRRGCRVLMLSSTARRSAPASHCFPRPLSAMAHLSDDTRNFAYQE